MHAYAVFGCLIDRVSCPKCEKREDEQVFPGAFLCNACLGTGEADDGGECPDCEGFGFIPCPTCGGRTYISIAEAESRDSGACGRLYF